MVISQYTGKKSSRVTHLESQLATLGFPRALAAMDLVLNEMCAEKGFKRHDGEHYYYHLIDVTQILLNFGIKDEDIVTAALLHDFIEDVPWATYEFVHGMFGKRVATIVQRLTKEPGVDYKTNLDAMRTYLRGIFDMYEAALIKTADRIHNFSSMRISSKSHRLKQVIETRDFYIPFFKDCRNRYVRYSNFFFFAKTTIEPIMFEIEQSITNATKIEELEAEIKKLNGILENTHKEQDELQQPRNTSHRRMGNAGQNLTLTDMLNAIKTMENQDTVNLQMKSMSDDALLYDAVLYSTTDATWQFITHIEVQFDNGIFNGNVLKCIPSDEPFAENEWVSVENQQLRQYIVDVAIKTYDENYNK